MVSSSRKGVAGLPFHDLDGLGSAVSSPAGSVAEFWKVFLTRAEFFRWFMGGVTIGAGETYPSRGGQNISSTYCSHVTKSIFYTFTQSLCHSNKFQSRHNSHTGHCYVISFGAGTCIDVIAIMKHMQCSVSCPPAPGKQNVGPHLQNPHLSRVWNSLPGTITDNLNITVLTFKSKLKTHLYACCYLGL